MENESLYGNFKITGGKGFHLKLPNGVTVSTQFGPGNYGDNYNEPFGVSSKDYQSTQCEVAAWFDVPSEKGSVWLAEEYEPGCGGVLGYKEMGEWLAFLDWCRAYVPDEAKLAQKAKENNERREKFRKQFQEKTSPLTQ